MGKMLFGLLAITVLVYIANYVNKKEKFDIIKAKNGDRQEIFDQLDLTKPLQIDFPNKLFRLSGYSEIFSFSELLSFKIYQDNNTITSGVSGASLNVGFGVSLGRTRDMISSEVVKKLDIVIVTAGRNEGRYTYNYINSNNTLQKNSDEFRILLEDAEETENLLHQIMAKK